MLVQIPFDEYLNRPALSQSGIKLLLKSPLHFKSSERTDTPELQFGRLLHSLALEPDKFSGEYAICPKVDLRTKAGKAEMESFMAENQGKTIASEDDFLKAQAMCESLLANKSVRRIMDAGTPEASLFGELCGVPAKCRMDWHRPGVVMDLKTTQSADAPSFSKSCANYGYHIQSAWYQDIAKQNGLEINAFLFVAIEKTKPYGVAIYELDDEAVEAGRIAYKEGCEIYKRCLETNEWPSYPDGIQTLSLPKWAIK